MLHGGYRVALNTASPYKGLVELVQLLLAFVNTYRILDWAAFSEQQESCIRKGDDLPLESTRMAAFERCLLLSPQLSMSSALAALAQAEPKHLASTRARRSSSPMQVLWGWLSKAGVCCGLACLGATTTWAAQLLAQRSIAHSQHLSLASSHFPETGLLHQAAVPSSALRHAVLTDSRDWAQSQFSTRAALVLGGLVGAFSGVVLIADRRCAMWVSRRCACSSKLEAAAHVRDSLQQVLQAIQTFHIHTTSLLEVPALGMPPKSAQDFEAAKAVLLQLRAQATLSQLQATLQQAAALFEVLQETVREDADVVEA